MDDIDVIERLLKFRAINNMSQKEFAKLANLSTQTISNFENMKSIKNQITMYKIMNAIEKYENKEN